MAVNKSQKRSPQAWNKWLMSGAIAGVHYKPGRGGFGTITFDRSMSVREILAFHKKCGLKLATLKDLETFAKHNEIPDAPTTVRALDLYLEGTSWLPMEWCASRAAMPNVATLNLDASSRSQTGPSFFLAWNEGQWTRVPLENSHFLFVE